jgi:hypothetical protein
MGIVSKKYYKTTYTPEMEETLLRKMNSPYVNTRNQAIDYAARYWPAFYSKMQEIVEEK